MSDCHSPCAGSGNKRTSKKINSSPTKSRVGRGRKDSESRCMPGCWVENYGFRFISGTFELLLTEANHTRVTFVSVCLAFAIFAVLHIVCSGGRGWCDTVVTYPVIRSEFRLIQYWIGSIWPETDQKGDKNRQLPIQTKENSVQYFKNNSFLDNVLKYI